MLMAPAVHPTGPSGSFSVAGSMSFENLYMVNGVSVNENLRGQAQDLVIEDAIQETTVATAGVSAEFGRFGGGVVNIVSKSGGNQFTGSFRETMTNDNWRALVPKRDRRSRLPTTRSSTTWCRRTNTRSAARSSETVCGSSPPDGCRPTRSIASW